MDVNLAFAISFFVALAMTLMVLPWLIPRLKERGIVGKDVNKPGQPEVAEMGGIAVVVGFFAGVSASIAFGDVSNPNLLNVSLSAALGAAFVGMMDDLFDLRQRHKAFLPFVLALPFGTMVDSHVIIPHVVEFDLGIWMPLVAAFAVTCAANAANMLEGFNGLGTGLGMIMAFTLAVLSLIHNRLDGMYLLVPLLGALIAFLWFNKYPAVVFPGDTMMLFMGATIAAAALLSKLEVQATFIFLPMIIEFFLKLKGHFEAENYATQAENDHLRYHGRIESLTHLFMKHAKMDERRLVLSIWVFEAVMCVIVVAVDLMLY